MIKAYVQDDRFEIDTNLVENSIRPVALGSKNYLFAGSQKAVKNTAMFYSFFATCKINKIEPLEWLTYALNIMSNLLYTRLHIYQTKEPISLNLQALINIKKSN